MTTSSIALVTLALAAVTAAANSYVNYSVNNIYATEGAPNLMIVALSCTAPDALTSGGNCTSGGINSKAFVFDSSTTQGKSELALLTAAMIAGKNIDAFTYGACPAAIPDTLWLYSLKIYK